MGCEVMDCWHKEKQHWRLKTLASMRPQDMALCSQHFIGAHFKTGLEGQPWQKKIRRPCHVKNSERNGECLGSKKHLSEWITARWTLSGDNEFAITVPQTQQSHRPARTHVQAYAFYSPTASRILTSTWDSATSYQGFQDSVSFSLV